MTAVREIGDWVWIGVNGFIAVWFAALALRGPMQPMHRPFAILAAMIALSHAASLAMIRAPDAATSARAQDAFMISMLVSGAAFVDVVTALAGERRAMPRHAWSVAAVGCVLTVSGACHDPSFSTSTIISPALARLTTVGLAAYLVTIVFVLLAAFRCLRAARTEPELRPLVAAFVLPTFVTLWDVYARISDAPGGHVSGLTRGIVVVALAGTLLRRFLAVERELAAKSEELVASTARLERAQAELDRTAHLAAVGELSAVIAHEIKNPLAVLHNAAATLKKVEHAEAMHLLEVLDEEADRLNRLVDDVLVYARPLTPETHDVDLVEVVSHATRLALDGQPTARNIVIDWARPEVPRWVRGDGTLIRHALINIVDNAILAMPTGGTVVVRMKDGEVQGHEGVAVEFTDEGEGMDTSVRERAKDPFFTTRETGTGLGLAIVDRVARVHGGAVSFASQAGVGTTVTFALPLRARASAIHLERGLGRDSLPPPFPIEARPIEPRPRLPTPAELRARGPETDAEPR